MAGSALRSAGPARQLLLCSRVHQLPHMQQLLAQAEAARPRASPCAKERGELFGSAGAAAQRRRRFCGRMASLHTTSLFRQSLSGRQTLVIMCWRIMPPVERMHARTH